MPNIKTPSASQNDLDDIASVSMLRLVSLLKPAQVWGILVVLFAVLSGTFGLAYKLRSYIADSEIAHYKSENKTIQDTIKQFRGIQTKEKFLALYLRYLISKEMYATDASDENQKDIQAAAENLRSYIEELLARGQEASEEIDLQGLFLGKGSGKKATVKFGYDGSVWEIPPQFGFAAKK
jgi:hypothetical protein